MAEEAVKPEPMDCSFGSVTGKLLPCPTMVVIMEGQEYQVVIDKWCAQTLVKASLIPAGIGELAIPTTLTCVHGENQKYQR